MTLAELNDWLEPHSDRIENFSSFTSNNLPKKLYQTATSNPITERKLNFNEEYNNEYNRNITLESQQAVNSAMVGLIDGKNGYNANNSALNQAAIGLVEDNQRTSYRDSQGGDKKSMERSV